MVCGGIPESAACVVRKHVQGLCLASGFARLLSVAHHKHSRGNDERDKRQSDCCDEPLRSHMFRELVWDLVDKVVIGGRLEDTRSNA
jgi:hypothetical protein